MHRCRLLLRIVTNRFKKYIIKLSVLSSPHMLHQSVVTTLNFDLV